MNDLHGCLITGAAGFLGTWLSKAARERKLDVVGIDVVAPSNPELFSAFAIQPCEHTNFNDLLGSRKLRAIFHLAGGASVAESVNDPIRDFERLLPGTVALINYVARHQCEAHVVLFSSAAVYGNPQSLPISENAPLKPISPYGIHKAAAEVLAQHYARLFNLRVSLLRLFSAYGEGLRKQVVWDLCQRMTAAQKTGQRIIVLRGTGDETRDFIHAADICRAAMLIADHPPQAEAQVLNVASGEETSVRAIAEIIAYELEADFEFAFDGARKIGDPVRWRADVRKLSAFGYSTMIPLQKGIARAVDWHQQTLKGASVTHSQ